MRPSTPIAVIHPGTQHSWQTAMALDQLGRLEFYATSIFYQPDRLPYNLARFVPTKARGWIEREFRRFEQPGLDPAKVRTAGLYEWLERIAARAGYRELARSLDKLGNRSFAKKLGHVIRSDKPFAIWGYNASSRDVFELARTQGRVCILDRTIGDWRAYNEIMDGVYADYAEFFPSPIYRIPKERIAADDREYELADVILAGSEFCAETLRSNAADTSVRSRVRILNYCYDERLFESLPQPDLERRGPVRFLFLGQAGPRKGFHLLLKVFARIPKSAAVLTVVGDMQVPPDVFARYADRCEYRPTVPRAEVPSLMMNSDVFVFPSYFEGSAISLYEALAAGNALIQSKNTGIAVSSDTGILLSEVSEDALYAAVMTAIEQPIQLAMWRANAQQAARRHSFTRYREDIGRLLDALGAGNPDE